MTNAWIPLQQPTVGTAEAEAVAALLRNGGRLAGDGPIGRRVEARLQRDLGVATVLLTPSGTSALELSMLLLDLRPGDEVLMPSYTFPSTATAVLAQGATPTFAEVIPETMTLDPDDLARRISPRTRAIVVVQYAGATGDFGRIEEIAERAGLPLIEDAAQAFGARWDGKALGTLGCSGIYSFHQTKSITSGEGGAFLCNDPELAERARVAREKGTNRGAFERGEVDCYSWVGPGGSHLMSEISAAILEVQLDRAPGFKALRRERWEAYRDGLLSWEARGMVRLPQIPSECEPNWETFFVLLPDRQLRNQCIEWMRGHQITTAFHHVPLHSSPMGKKLGSTDLPVTEMLASRLLRLPLYPELRAEDGARVLEILNRFMRAL